MGMDSKEFDGVRPEDTRKKQEISDIKGFICLTIFMWIIVIISITRREFDIDFIMAWLMLSTIITIAMLYLLIGFNRRNKKLEE